jgi:predicted house-cleaning noncanonical NTP pyrophosphatase (MazG superfamily)
VRHNKLVRDRIPELIERAGRRPVTRVLDDAEYPQALLRKLQEEAGEFERSAEVEELADVLEVVYALAALQGSSPQALECLRERKRLERGGFQQRLWLIETLDGDGD